MPVTFKQFETQFDKLQAAFSVTRTSKIIDQWYQQFKDCEYEPFVKAMNRLLIREKFPNWGMVWAEYRNLLSPASKVKGKTGCQYCNDGSSSNEIARRVFGVTR